MKFTQEISIFNPHAIEYAVVSLGTRITQTADEILLEADKKLTNYSTTVEMNSAISQKADQITLEVSETYATIGSVNADVASLSSRITQNATSITAEVTNRVNAVANEATARNTAVTNEANARYNADSSLSARITVNATAIESRVEKGSIISTINQSAEAVTINASKVNLSGYVTLTNLSTAGQTTINGANITTGTINANRIAAIPVSKVTGSITNSNNWALDFTNGTFTIGNISANNITSGTLTGRDISGGRILQVVSGAQHGDIWGSGSSFETQASIQNGIVRAGQYVLNGVDILAEGVDWDGAGSAGIQVCGHLSTVGTIWAGDEYTDKFRVNCRGNIWTNNIWVNNLGGWITDYVSSDRRHKDNIKAIDYEKAVNFIESLKPVSFVYTNRTDKGIHHGFIAQDVQEIAYDDWGLVQESENPDTGEDYLTLSYDDLIADLVAVIQEQEKRITELERKNANE